MRFAWLATLAVACGPPGGAKRPHGDPHASREAIVHEAFARMTAGDADGLVALADANEAFARGLWCETARGVEARMKLGELAKRMQEELRAAAVRGKGTAVEVLGIEPSRLDLGKLVEEGGCVALVPSAHETLKVKVRVAKAERTVEVDVLDVGGRLYLVALPRRLSPDPLATRLVTATATTAQKVCACADLACAQRFLDDYTAARDEWVRTTKEKLEPNEVAQMKAAMETITECVAKLRRSP